MAFVPVRATLGLTAATFAVLGVQSIDIDDATLSVDGTVDAATVETSLPTIKSPKITAKILYDATDSSGGRAAMKTSADNLTTLAYVATKGGKTFTFSAWIEIKWGGGPKDETVWDVTFHPTTILTIA